MKTKEETKLVIILHFSVNTKDGNKLLQVTFEPSTLSNGMKFMEENSIRKEYQGCNVNSKTPALRNSKCCSWERLPSFPHAHSPTTCYPTPEALPCALWARQAYGKPLKPVPPAAIKRTSKGLLFLSSWRDLHRNHFTHTNAHAANAAPVHKPEFKAFRTSTQKLLIALTVTFYRAGAFVPISLPMLGAVFSTLQKI